MVKIWRPYDTYEYSDFNRIESTIKAAYSQFRKSMSLHDQVETVTNRSISSVFVVEDINRIEKNLKYVDFSGTFERRTWEEGDAFTYYDANRWERMADLLRRAMAGIQAIRCGTHKCGTWPMYSVIGLVVRKNETACLDGSSVEYEVPACGTKPQSSVIGKAITDGHVIEAYGASAEYGVTAAGTEPEYAIIGLIVQQDSAAQISGATIAFEADVCGQEKCGTVPETSEIEKAIEKAVSMAHESRSEAYTQRAAGMKYCGEET